VPRLAIAGLLLAEAVPFLVHAASSNVTYLFAYILGVTAIYLCLSWWQKNTELTVTTFCTHALLSVLALMGILSGDQSALVLLEYIFGVVFLVASTVGLQRTVGEAAKPYVLIACMNSLLIAAWIYTGVAHEMQALVYAAWCAVYVYLGFVTMKLRGTTAPFYINALIASVFLVLATMMQFEGVVLAVVLLLESAASVLATALVTRKAERTNLVLFTTLLPIASSVIGISTSYWGTADATPFMSYGIFAAVLLGLGVSLTQILRGQTIPNITGIWVVGALYAAAYIWTTTHVYIASYQAATVVSLLVYTVVGVGCYVQGILKNMPLLKHAGTIILVLVIARLLLIDLGNMDITGKVLAFTGVGVLFIAASFISRNK
jgi:Predicted membrane protein (DUF2339)